MPYTAASRAKLHATMIKKIQGEYPGLSDTEALNVWKVRQKGLGRKGGQASNTGGFAANRELAVTAGRLGGLKSRRRKQNESK